MHRSDTLPALDVLEPRRLYRLRCRNLKIGVFDGDKAFIGIRTKFGTRFLETELHWDADDHYGTVADAKPLDAWVPDSIYLATEKNNPLFDWLIEQEKTQE